MAVEDSGDDAVTYTELVDLSTRVAGALVSMGVGPGDRVGLYLPKSIGAVAAIHGAMMAGAAYVPVDHTAPARRNATIHLDCGVRATIVAEDEAAAYGEACGEIGEAPPLLIVPGTAGSGDMSAALEAVEAPASEGDAHTVVNDDLAYILYTSGSTGRPKGVMLTHGNATSFVEWCVETFRPTEDDRCSSHAPFHFDLSILDIYMALASGATLVLVSEDLGKDPVALGEFIAQRKITVWYSAPSILSLLAEFGRMDQHDYEALRLVLFAGEVFPVKHLRALTELLPHPTYYNLYGPTETNVCTYYRIPDVVDPGRVEPYPIGRACSHSEVRVVDPRGSPVGVGEEGELVVRGPAVTSGYWNLPERTAQAFHTDGEAHAWYRTGDVVVESAEEGYVFLGRRDRMIKKRGFRIELGEIEARLYEHPRIQDVAVVDERPEAGDVRVVAFVVSTDGERLSIIALKTFSSERLPSYMIPDRFVQLPMLPHTSTDKVDYQNLRGRLEQS